MIGQYVHYIIRFENTGTAGATNIVVKDLIDAEKFDISTLVPLDASHNFYTKITGNKAEFIFENIDLPSAPSELRHGVAFKIKLHHYLQIGDTFSNLANIYFDYNFPIVTNIETTSIQTLSTGDFGKDADITLYPNPATTSVNLSIDEVHKVDYLT